MRNPMTNWYFSKKLLAGSTISLGLYLVETDEAAIEAMK
jgi:hypothetical protein